MISLFYFHVFVVWINFVIFHNFLVKTQQLFQKEKCYLRKNFAVTKRKTITYFRRMVIKSIYSEKSLELNMTRYNNSDHGIYFSLLHFAAFFHVYSLFFKGVDNKKVGVDNEKALELTNSTVFHKGRQWKSSRAGQQNIFFIFQPDFNVEISPKNATKHPVA